MLNRGIDKVSLTSQLHEFPLSQLGQLNRITTEQIQCINSKLRYYNINWNNCLIKSHRFYAIKQRFSSFGLDDNDISFLNYGKEEEDDTTVKKLELYGFVTLDDKNNVKFYKEIMADFFVAEFVIKIFFSVSNDKKVNELKMVHKILEIILENPEDYQSMCKLMIGYLKIEGLTEKPCDQMLDLISGNTEKVREKILKIRNRKVLRILLELWSLLLSSKVSSLDVLWESKEDHGVFKRVLLENFLKDCIKKDNIDYEHFLNTIEILDQTFGSKSYEIFKKSDIKLFSKADIQKSVSGSPALKIKDDDVQKFYLNLLNLLKLINVNFENSEAKLIYQIYFYELKLITHIDENICMDIITIYDQLFDNNKIDLANLIILFIEYNKYENLGALADKITTVLAGDKISLMMVLTYEYDFNKHPIIKAIMSKNVKNFEKISKLYIDCPKSLIEVRKILTYVYNFPSIFLHMNKEINQNFVDFMKIIFDGHQIELNNFVNDKIEICIQLLMSDESWECFKEFGKAFFKDEKNNRAMVRKILFCNYIFNNHPIYEGIKSEKLRKIINLYENYMDDESEIQDIFINSNNDFLKVFNNPSTEIFDDFFKFFKKYFDFGKKNQTEKQKKSEDLRRSLRTYFRKNDQVHYKADNKVNFDKFMAFVFANENINNIIKRADHELKS